MMRHNAPTRHDEPAGKRCRRSRHHAPTRRSDEDRRPEPLMRGVCVPDGLARGVEGPLSRLTGQKSRFLIDTLAIRIEFNALKTKQKFFSNRHSAGPANLHNDAALRASVVALRLEKQPIGHWWRAGAIMRVPWAGCGHRMKRARRAGFERVKTGRAPSVDGESSLGE